MLGKQTASDNPPRSPSSGAPESLEQRLKVLEDGAASKRKDIWDKLGVLSGLITGLLVAFIGFYATNIYDKRSKDAELSQQARSTIATELQTVEKFFPHLASGNEKEKEAAILAVSSLGNTELAAKLATLFGGAGANAALTSIAASSDPSSKDRLVAQTALTDLYKAFRPSIVRVKVRSKTGNLIESGTGFVVSRDGYVITTDPTGPTAQDSSTNWIITISNNTGEQTAKIIKIDDQFHLALLKIDLPQEQQPLPITIGPTPTTGERISVLGVPYDAKIGDEGFELLSIAGEVASVADNERQLTLSAPLLSGMSGSPVFGSKGQIVAIVLGWRKDSLIIAIPIQVARPLLLLAGAA